MTSIGVQAHQVVNIGRGEPAQHKPLRLKENLHRQVMLTFSGPPSARPSA
jgi:hypothetical protein